MRRLGTLVALAGALSAISGANVAFAQPFYSPFNSRSACPNECGRQYRMCRAGPNCMGYYNACVRRCGPYR